MIMRYHFEHRLQWLQARKKRYGGLTSRPHIQKMIIWQSPPNEIAARMVAKRYFYGAESWHGILNQISSQK